MKLIILLNLILLLALGLSLIRQKSKLSFGIGHLLLVILWATDPVFQNLSERFQILNLQVVAGKLVLSDFLYYLMFISVLTLMVFRSLIRESLSLRDRLVGVRALLPFVLAFYALAQSLLFHQGWLQPLVSAGIYFLVMMLPNRIDVETLRLSAIYAFTLILISQLIHLAGSQSTAPCRLDKCIYFDFVYSGNGNGLGLRIMFISLVICALGNSHRLFIFGLLIVPYLVFLGGRTSLYVYLLCFSLLHLVRIVAISWRSPLRKAIVYISFTISLIPVFVSFDDATFTFRGQLWNSAKRIFSENVLIGHGPSYWVYIGGDLGFFANNGTHNIWLDSLVSGGILSAIIFGYWVLITNLKLNLTQPDLFILIGALVLAGTVESVFSFWKIAFGFPVVVTMLLLRTSMEEEEYIKEHIPFRNLNRGRS
jgi:O-antigen ligase